MFPSPQVLVFFLRSLIPSCFHAVSRSVFDSPASSVCKLLFAKEAARLISLTSFTVLLLLLLTLLWSSVIIGFRKVLMRCCRLQVSVPVSLSVFMLVSLSLSLYFLFFGTCSMFSISVDTLVQLLPSLHFWWNTFLTAKHFLETFLTLPSFPILDYLCLFDHMCVCLFHFLSFRASRQRSRSGKCFPVWIQIWLERFLIWCINFLWIFLVSFFSTPRNVANSCSIGRLRSRLKFFCCCR